MNVPTDINPLFDPATDNQKISDESQKMVNTPLAGGKVSDEDQELLNLIMKLVEDSTIDLHRPETLVNQPVYEGLSQEAKGKADLNAMNMLGKIRDIVDLEKQGGEAAYQKSYLISSLRQNKERLEKEGGDIFII